MGDQSGSLGLTNPTRDSQTAESTGLKKPGEF